MNNLIAAVYIALLSLILCSCYMPKENSKAAPILNPEKLGFKSIAREGKIMEIPWYRVKADYLSLRQSDFWTNLSIPVPPGTKFACVGYYHEIQWCLWLEDKNHVQMAAWGFSFYDHKLCGLETTKLHTWLYEEKGKGSWMTFQKDRYYVFCFDRKPEAKEFVNNGLSVCDLSSELDHLSGIIELEPTFEPKETVSVLLKITEANLISYHEQRINGLTGGYEFEFGIEREAGQFRCKTHMGEAEAPALLMQKLFYAINTLTWETLDTPIAPEEQPATKTTIEYKDAESRVQKVVLEYQNGSWIMSAPDGRQNLAAYPQILYEVKEEIEKLCVIK